MRKAPVNELQLETDVVEGYPRLRLHGEGERCGAASLQRSIQELLADGSDRLIVDTRDLMFLHPACVETLASVAKELAECGGTLVLIDSCLPVERALKLMGLERVVPVLPTTARAVAYLDGLD